MFRFINCGTKIISPTVVNVFLLINFDIGFYVRYRSEEISPGTESFLLTSGPTESSLAVSRTPPRVRQDAYVRNGQEV